MVIRASSTSTAPGSNLLISCACDCIHVFIASFFLSSSSSSNEIYRWIKIGLWIWFIATKLFGWIFLPVCPWSSQESFTWHPATNHSISSSLPPSSRCIFMFCGAELISVNFWKALCYTVKWASKEVIREEVSGWWSVILCYSIFLLATYSNF